MRKCFEVECGGELTAATENYAYAACGLPYVTLEGVTVRRCGKCGKSSVKIPNIEGMHRELARGLVRKPSRLMGEEIRFLRKYLGWSREDCSEQMGVAPTSISRWESGRSKMSIQADRFLRLLADTKDPVAEYQRPDLSGTARGEAVHARLRLERGRAAWQQATA